MNEVLKFIIALKWSEQLSYLFQEGDLHKKLKNNCCRNLVRPLCPVICLKYQQKVNKEKPKFPIFTVSTYKSFWKKNGSSSRPKNRIRTVVIISFGRKKLFHQFRHFRRKRSVTLSKKFEVILAKLLVRPTGEIFSLYGVKLWQFLMVGIKKASKFGHPSLIWNLNWWWKVWKLRIFRSGLLEKCLWSLKFPFLYKM